MKYLLIILLVTSGTFADDWIKIKNLSGTWKFSIGDDPKWASPDFNDSSWESVYAPSAWETQGFHNYNGYAWYRKTFELNEASGNDVIYLILGYIDDVDEVYLNGKLVGVTGSFPPNYTTAYNAYRRYPIPSDMFNLKGKNTIAVRVFDSQLDGGILSGDLGLFKEKSPLILDVNLAGKWKFIAEDNQKYAMPDFDDTGWNEILVPGYWETQGYKDYDGFAWYRKSFNIKKTNINDSYVVVLGKIDDIDEVYLNGEKIGSTGIMPDNRFNANFKDEWFEFRGYYIRGSELKIGKNIIAVKVFDGYKDGGIYEGPIGIAKQKEYISFWNSRKGKKNFFEIFFEDLFDK